MCSFSFNFAWFLLFFSCSLFGCWESVEKWEGNSNDDEKKRKVRLLFFAIPNDAKLKTFFNCLLFFSYPQFGCRESVEKRKF